MFKKVIRLDVYYIFVFTLYYDPSPPSWKVMANRMSSFLWYCHYQKGRM